MCWTSYLNRTGRARGGAMEVNPVKFLSLFFVISSIGWVLFTFAARLLAWILSRTIGASVQFRVAGCNCARDVLVKFKKGAVESVAIGEIKLSLRKSLVKLGCSMISRDPKLQLLLSDLEVVIRHPQDRKKMAVPQHSHSARRGKWMIITNIIKYISISVTELIVKIPKSSFEVKELKLDIFKDGTSSSSLGVKLHLFPCNIFLGEQRTYDHDSSYSFQESNSAPVYLEELLIVCQFGYAREMGVTIKRIEGTCGEVLVNLNDDIFKTKTLAKEKTEDVDLDKSFDPKPREKFESMEVSKAKDSFPMLSAKKSMLAFPENVSFTLPKLSMKYFYKGQGLTIENDIMGIQLQSSRPPISDDMGDSTSQFDIQIDFSEIHCLKEGSTSILEILKVAVAASFHIPRELTMPVRVEVDIKLGGTQCNLLTKRLKPWMDLYFTHKMKNKGTGIQSGDKPYVTKPHGADYKVIMWECTVSAPETTVILYNLNDLPVYHATAFPPQVLQDVYIGRWHKVEMLRSMSGTTPPLKMYSQLPIHFERAEVAYGVGFEPAFADVSYAFTVALRRANLSNRNVGTISLGNVSNSVPLQAGNHIPTENQPVKKERSLPWWDDMRYYIHGRNSINSSNFKLILLGTTDPYESVDKLQIVANNMDIQQSEGRVTFSAKEFNIFISSLEHILKNYSLKLPTDVMGSFISSPAFQLDITMDWECESGNPLNHYLHALPSEREPRKKVYDPFRSTSLSLRWNFSLKPSYPMTPVEEAQSSTGDADRVGNKVKTQVAIPARKSNTERNSYDSASITLPEKLAVVSMGVPAMNLGAHDLIWIFRWWNLYYNPPHKLRSFSRWPRFGVPRLPRSGNLSLDKVITEFMLRVDSTPTCMKHVPLGNDDPANGLTFNMTKLKYELCYSRGRQCYTFDCKRDPLDLVYQGLDLHMLKAELKNDSSTRNMLEINTNKNIWKQSPVLADSIANKPYQETGVSIDKANEDGFLFNTDYFTIRKQSPKVDPARLISWQEAGRSIRSLETTYVRSEFDYGSDNDPTLSDPSDDDGFNVVLADNCQRVFVYGLKLLWTIKNRDAVWAWVGEIAKAFESPKPSPSRQYAQRKMIEEQQKLVETGNPSDDVPRSLSPKRSKGARFPSSPHHAERGVSSPSPSSKPDCSSSVQSASVKAVTTDDKEEEGAMNFMVNVIQPQFNLHSEEANGRFLLAAASGRVLARSLYSVVNVGFEMIEQALGGMHIPGCEPEVTWKRRELSVMLEHVQAHVAPTDVDPDAGLQWLPKIPRSSPEVKRTGALLERVFLPCTMYFRYTRHKGATADLKVKPLKELSFNSPNITATMTSRQFQVMVDILSNLLFARLPKPRKSSLLYHGDEEEGVEEETDEVVPDGVEEVELARVKLEQAERECKLVLADARTIAVHGDFLSLSETDLSPEKDGALWMISSGKPALVQKLKKELGNKHKARKAASASLRLALQRAAHQRLMEKEKNKSPSFAMRISWVIDKVVWTMFSDGKAFAEAEISNMILNVDRDYKDVGVAEFTTRSFVVRNCLANAKSDMLLSAWNPPLEWGRNVMLRVDARQGAPKDGNSPLELFQVEIYPLKIHLTETMYKMMWEYFFPEEEQDSKKPQEVWKVSTTAGSKRGKRGLSSGQEQVTSSSKAREDSLSRGSAPGTPLVPIGISQSHLHGDPSQVSFLMAAQVLEASRLQNHKTSLTAGPRTEHHRTSSLDRTSEENGAESTANEFVFHGQGSSLSCSKSGPLSSAAEHPSGIPTGATAGPITSVDTSKNRLRDCKPNKAGRSSHEEKKLSKSQDEKKDSRVRKTLEFQDIKISQVELLVTYEGSRFAVNELRLLMDTFHRVYFTGTWRRLFSRVKKHIIWGVLKSVTGMQGKKFKDKVQGQRQADEGASPDSDLNFSDSDGSQPGKYDPFPVSGFKKPSDRAGEGFVTSIRGLFNSQRKKAKAFVIRTVRGDAENEFQGECSNSDAESPPFARQLTITKARRIIQRHTKKFRSSRHKGMPFVKDSFQSSPKTTPFQSEADSSSVSSAYEDFHD